MKELTGLLVFPQSSIRDAIACIDCNRRGIAIVVDDSRHLLGTITDGDVRRAMLCGINLEAPVSELLACKAGWPNPHPVVAPMGTERGALLQIMQEHMIRQIPLIDEGGRVSGLVTLDDLLSPQDLPLQAMVMAGGLGKRLHPLTEETPKPMLPVGERPLMELIIQQLRDVGIKRVNVSTYHKPEKISGHFGDGHEFGVDIRYVHENQPLGTAGALRLLDRESSELLLVINGDILTGVDFRAMVEFHREHRADLTVAVRQYEFKVPYGVVETDGVTITGISEKPVFRSFINAGIYLLKSEVCRYIPSGQSYEMPDVVQLLVKEGRPVVGFPVHEYWLDIGQIGDYQKAQEDLKNGMLRPRIRPGISQSGST